MLRISLLGLFFGTIGTTIGGLIGTFSKRNSNKFLSFVLSFASGLMLAVVCFSLIPKAMEISSIYITIIGMIIGIVTMIICDILVNKKFNTETHKNNGHSIIDERVADNKILKAKNRGIFEETYRKKMSLLKTGIIVSVGLALHNIPEGLAIGSGFDASTTLGLSLAIAICLHDVPEGISMTIPMKNGGMSAGKVMFYVILSGIATGFGALIGAIVGNISIEVIAICLAFAAGAMLYIVSGELIPEYNSLYHGRMSALGNMLGFILGLFAMIIS